MISRAEAVDMLRSDDLIGIGMQADSVRRRLHPAGVVTYAIDCAVECGLGEQAAAEIRRSVELGGTGVRFQGSGDIECYEELLRSAGALFPNCDFSISATDIQAIAAASGLALAETLARLRNSGLESVSGEVRDGEIHRIAHAQGLKTTATMTFGTAETPDFLMGHLDLLRGAQEETGGFTAFVPLMKNDVTAVEYLKTLAISRVYLENILNIESSSMMPGLKTAQLGLRFGSNDIGSVPLGQSTEEQLRHIIRDAGFVPKQRDGLYRTWFLS